MAKLHMISQAAATSAAQAPLGVKPNHYYTARRETYFFDYVKEELIQRYGVNTVRKGGLKVYTTIELKAPGGGAQRDRRASCPTRPTPRRRS